MTPQQWREAWEIFQAAQALPESGREEFIASRSTDPAILARVANLFIDLNSTEDEQDLPSREILPGQQVGRYLIEKQIGRGTYGEVWAGRDTALGRPVALKFIVPERQADQSATKRFLREARAASALNHPHIVVVHEVIASDAGPVIVMELIDGVPLRSIMNSPVPQAKAISISIQILRAIAFAHAAGVVHRDLKPENIIVRPDGFVKVLDFGLARREIDAAISQSASTGTSVGTLRYMSPEQCQGLPASSASDIFAIGTILYELFAGKHPFESSSWIDTVHSIVNREAPLPGPCGVLVARMLSKSAAARPSAEEAAKILESTLQPETKPLTSHIHWKWWARAAALAALAWFAFQLR